MSTQDISTLAVKVTSDGITATSNKLDKLTIAADKAELAVKKLGTQVVTSNQNIAGASGATVALTNAILLLNSNINSLTQSQINNTRTTQGNTHAMRDAHDAARGLAGSLGALWVTYGNMLPLAAGLAVGAAVKGILSSGKDVEHAIESMRVKGDESMASAGKLRDTILSIGQGVYGPKEVAGALDTLILAGLDAEQAMVSVKAALNLATAGGGTIEKAATALVTIGTAVGASAEHYDMLADGITKAANTSLASVDSISEAVKRGSVVNKLYGASFEDILVQAAGLSQLGIKNTAAGTAISNFYGDVTAKTEKAKKAFKELEMSFYTATGKARPLVEAVEELDQKLKGFDQKKQLSLRMDIFGERGLRDGVAMLDLVNTAAKDATKYKNRLAEIRGEIALMAGTAALAAAQLSLTTENQLKSVKNTLDVTLVKVFRDMEPQINVVAMRLKAVFGSSEFKQGITSMANAVASFTVAVVENISALAMVVEGILAYKLIMAGGALFTAMIPYVAGLAVAFGAVGTSATGAAVATGVFGTAIKMLPGIGLILGGIAALFALVAFNSGKVRDAAEDVAKAYNTNYLAALTDEAERLEKTNALMAKGNDLRKAETMAMKEQALEKARGVNMEAVSKAQTAYDTAKSQVQYHVGDGEGAFRRRVAAQAAEALALENLNRIKATASDFDRDQLAMTGRIVAASEEQRVAYLAEQAAKEKAYSDQSSKTNGGAQAPDAKAEAYRSFLEGERLELERLRDSYKARTEAMLEGAAAGKRVMADVEQARVRANGNAGKYANAEVERAQLTLAAQVDSAKFEQQKANAITEQNNKITAILNREKEYQAAVADGSRVRMGLLEKETLSLMKFNGVKGEALEQAQKDAALADEKVRVEAARVKLVTSTGSSGQRAGSLEEEADAILMYGKGAKQTALEVAKLEVEKLKLTNTGSALVIQQRLEKAGLEDISKSYNDFANMIAGNAEREAADNLASVSGVLGAESAKVVAHQQATEAIIASGLARAKAGMAAAKSPEALAEAQETYNKMLKAAEKFKAQTKKYFTIDLKVAGLKDVSSMLGGLGKAAAGMGASFQRAAGALDGLAESFTTLAEVEAKEGIDDAERMQGKIGAYGDMAGAAAGFFEEGSKGYNTMMGISKVFHAAEMAMGLVRMGQKAVEAVLNQANGDPYTAFARMAAMAAVVAALGFAVGGGFNSNQGGRSAEDVQKTQGTGSVFGDSGAKSESISNSLKLLEENSNIMLPVNQAMLESLRAIESNMSGLTNLVIRTPGMTDASNMGIKTGTLKRSSLFGMDTKQAAIAGGVLFGPLGAVLGGIAGKVASWYGSTKQKIVDSGFSMSGKVADLQDGKGFNQYASVDTTKKKNFGLSKKTTNAVQATGLSDELSDQFGLIFVNLEDTLKLAAGPLGRNAAEIGNVIDNLVLSTNSISLHNLKGDELQAAINAVISKGMDEIAEAAFPVMGKFRGVGEGYAQTVIRVASGIETANLAMEMLGITAINYAAITNKQGDVATEIAKQSIAAVEGMSGINAMLQGMGGSMQELVEAYKELSDIRKAMNGVGLNGNKLNVNAIKGAGGVAQLSSALATYQDKYFTEQEKAAIMLKSVTADFNKLGVALPVNKKALRDLITSTGMSTDASSKLTGQLLGLSGAYAELIETNEEARTAATDNLMSSIEALKAFSDEIKAFKDSLLLGDLSTLTPTEKYIEAKRQYESTVAKALTGDVTAQGNVTGSAQAFLEASRVVNASDSNYTATFEKVLADMDKLEAKNGMAITEAEKQLAILQKQADGIDQLNLTAEAIATSLQAIAVATPPPAASAPVDNAALIAELAQLRAEVAQQAADAAKAAEQRTASVWDAVNYAAKQIIAGNIEAVKEAAWADNNGKVTNER